MPSDAETGDAESATVEQSAREEDKGISWFTNDAAALLAAGTLCLLMVVGITPYYKASSGVETAFIGYVSVSAAWLFGKGASQVIFGGGRK